MWRVEPAQLTNETMETGEELRLPLGGLSRAPHRQAEGVGQQRRGERAGAARRHS